MIDKGFAYLEKNVDGSTWEDIKSKRYPSGGICDFCGNESEQLFLYEEEVCRECINKINKKCNTHFEITAILPSRGCDFCCQYFQSDSLFGKVRLNLCISCMRQVGLNTKRNNQTKFKIKT